MDDDLKLKLILEAQDKLTSVLAGVSKSADKSFSTIENKLLSVSNRFNDFGNKFTMVGASITAVGLGAAHAFKLTSTVNEVFEFEHSLRSLGNVGGLTETQLKSLGKQIRQVGAETNNYNKDILEGMNTLVAAGMNPEKAIGYMKAIGKTATSQQAEINDIAITTFAIADNMKVPLSQIEKSLNVLTSAGKEGRFELKAMAQYFPAISASAGALKMQGVPAVAALGSALQIAMKAAGSEGEAATNLERFMKTLTAPHTLKLAEDTWGISFEKVMKNAASRGADPILEVMNVIQEKTNGDLFRIGDVFHDKTATDFIIAMTQNLDEYKRIKSSILSSDSVIDDDFASIMSTTTENWKKLNINMQKTAFEKLETPLKAVNKVLTVINNTPALQKGLFNAIVGTISIGTLTAGIGLISKLSGTVMSEYVKFAPHIAKMLPATLSMRQNIFDAFFGLPNIINTSFKSMVNFIKAAPAKTLFGIKAGLTSIKLGFVNFIPSCQKAISTIRLFTSAALFNPVGLAIAGIAAGAFLILKFWQPLTSFFKGTFSGIKDGLAPLQPLFTNVGKSIQPMVTWIKKFFTPINTDGKKAENWGYQFGKGIAWCITKVVDAVSWVTKLITLGGRIKFGDKSLTISDSATKTKEDGSHANGLNRVPFDGYIAKTHKNEAILTANEAADWRKYKQGGKSSSFSLSYSPIINLNSGNSTPKSELLEELRKHKNEVAALVKEVLRREEVRAYA